MLLVKPVEITYLVLVLVLLTEEYILSHSDLDFWRESLWGFFQSRMCFFPCQAIPVTFISFHVVVTFVVMLLC